MSSLTALQARVAALEALVEERDARIAELERAVDTLTTTSPAGRWTAKEVRKAFIEFFEENQHTFWPSSPCVPYDDPTLLFANAGMNQFKPLFLGQCDPSKPMANLKRATNSQKCIRAGGKHNDLDDVGKDVYHHTFFEMLGNWSFGDYFKEEAISMAWRCLTEKYGLDPSRLYVTYFGGDEVKAPGVPSDEETRQIWLKVGVPEDRVLPFDAADNFWEMGDTGPCGPCTEIHYDRIGGRDAASLVNMDDPMVLEIWNNVFIQYNRDATGLKPLPAQHVDTGMGFERLTSILQEKTSNYDTDVFMPLFEAIQKITGAEPYTGLVGEEDVTTKDMAYRVVADHIRTLTFAITDGARPDSVGRGYVLRRILRRAVYYGTQFLGAKPGFFHKLVPAVIANFGEFFTELVPNQAKVAAVLQEEEAQFNKTIKNGLKHFSKKAQELQDKGINEYPGAEVFFLSSSLGFPMDLTEIMAERRGMTIDKPGYEAALQEEKDKNSKSVGETDKNMKMESDETVWLANGNVPVTDSQPKYTSGWSSTATVLAVFTGRGQLPTERGFVDAAGPDDGMVGVILNTTPFYAEMGGQIFDTGVLSSADGAELPVVNVQTYAGYVVHMGSVAAGRVAVGDEFTCAVDYERRAKIKANHTMTHTLNWALRQVLMGGAQAENPDGKLDQKGSDCDDKRLRFDFAWDNVVDPDQLAAVEGVVNGHIQSSLPVYEYVSSLEDAKKVYGLRQVFGEAYPDPVRIISIGADPAEALADPNNERWGDFSVEFCGGTHLDNLAEAEQFVLTEESSVQKGVRRLSAVTRDRAREATANADRLGEQLTEIEALSEVDLVARLNTFKLEVNAVLLGVVAKHALMQRVKPLEARVLDWKKAQTKAKAAAAVQEIKQLAKETKPNMKVVARIDFGADGKTASKVIKEFSKGNKTSSLMLISADPDAGKFSITVSVAKPQQATLDGLQWCTVAVDAAGGGKSGGKGPNAMGSANLANIDAAMDAARQFVA